ncbi:MAG: DNA polymerase III subunit alpha [Limnochordia bacterium]
MFAALHVHSEYSLSRSCIRIDALARKAQSLGYKALALTDHNTMGGLVEFYRACREHGLKPILGLELDLEDAAGCPGIVLLAENHAGYENLLKLASAAKPVKLDTLSRHTAGLVGMITAADPSPILGAYERLAQVFSPDCLFVELPVDEPRRMAAACKLAEMLPRHVLAAAQNLYHLEANDRQVLDVLRPEGGCSGSYLPLLAPDQIRQICRQWPEALENAELIAERCSVELRPETVFPKLPEEHDLRRLAFAGARERYGKLDQEITARLEYELDVIEEMGFSDYFLIVWDIVRFAKEAQIPVGPGRGSAAGSLVAYCLGITDVDPIAHKLFFERFLNRQRRNLPDIDLDICYLRREEVIQYIVSRFGRDHVAKIGTYGTFGHKSAELEIKKILDRREPELVQRLIGLKQYFSTHAAGVIITPRPVTSYSGVEEVDGAWVTQLAMDDLAYLGVLKIDFLGLRTLTILKDIELSVQRSNPGFTLKGIPFADQPTLRLLQQGLTLGIFQVESQLFQELLPQIKPDSFADLVAALALVRPGPLKQVPVYARRKEGLESVRYVHPKLESILGDTYGLMIYQEQVMQVAHEIAGLSLEEADLLRAAMSKKDHSSVQKLRSKFITGCLRAGLTQRAGRELYTQIDRFADYAFNKAHSTAYAVITWQMAYLKANYPIQFYIGLLKHTSDLDKAGDIYQECRQRGIRVLPPDIRFSEAWASVEANGLRIGFGNLKQIGLGHAQALVKERTKREYSSLTDLLARVELHQNTKLALVYSGALDCFGDRRRILAGLAPEMAADRISDLALLEKEKEIVGIYLSGHPVKKWEGFLDKLEPSLGRYAAGHIRHVRKSGRHCSGMVIGDDRRCRFVLPTTSRLWHDRVREGELAALFGNMSGDQLEVEWILPLKPLLMLVPKPDKIRELKDVLVEHGGDTPVLFSLGSDLIQLIDPRFWIDPKPVALDAVAGLVEYMHWIDPWQSRVLDGNMELTKGKYLAGGR